MRREELAAECRREERDREDPAAGALVSPTWSWIQVPLGGVVVEDGTLAAQRVLEGDGWRLTLPPGWRITRSGARVEVRPPG